MTPLQIAATGFALVSGLVVATLGIEARYEKAASAESAHDAIAAKAAEDYEQLAAENDTARLQLQLDIAKLKVEKFIDISKVRPLTQDEIIELRAAEKERDLLLERLATKG